MEGARGGKSSWSVWWVRHGRRHWARRVETMRQWARGTDLDARRKRTIQGVKETCGQHSWFREVRNREFQNYARQGQRNATQCVYLQASKSCYSRDRWVGEETHSERHHSASASKPLLHWLLDQGQCKHLQPKPRDTRLTAATPFCRQPCRLCDTTCSNVSVKNILQISFRDNIAFP